MKIPQAKPGKNAPVAFLHDREDCVTTLLNTLSGLILDIKLKEKRKGGERITLYGSVSFEGRDISLAPAYERVRQGIVLCRERHPVFLDSSVVENRRIAGYLLSRVKVREGFEQAFGFFPNLVRVMEKPASAGKCARRKRAGSSDGGGKKGRRPAGLPGTREAPGLKGGSLNAPGTRLRSGRPS
ncbi:MAG: hypothetical protein AB1896_06910, partial [Thermodesulfobacteriota bacterium]